MPIYAFTCPRCGPFDLRRPMAAATEPAWCATCGAAAERVFTPPGLPILARPMRRAREAEEKSGHEPAVVTEKRGRPLPRIHTAAPPWTMGG